jgi:hypothetical protein
MQNLYVRATLLATGAVALLVAGAAGFVGRS